MRLKVIKKIIGILVCLCYFGCSSDDVNTTALYNGNVCDATTNEPLSNIPVVVTDGSNIHVSTKTDAEGNFSFIIVISEINNSYYILIGDETCIQKKLDIPGFASGITSLGSVLIVGPSIPIVNLLGHKIDQGIITAKGEVIEDGRLDITERGFCYSISSPPTIQDHVTSCGTGLGSFSATINVSDLNVSSTYYFRPYATNNKGTAYGESFTLTTGDGLPIVEIPSSTGYNGISKITTNSVMLEGNLINNGGFEVTERGFCFDTIGEPTIDKEHKYIGGGDLGHYTITLDSLKSNTKYYVRAYAKNKNGVNYSQMVEFTTEKGTEDVSIIELSSMGIAVQSEDIGYNNWNSINLMCTSSTLGGYHDWRLPTNEELMALFTIKNNIGGFSKMDYWSSDSFEGTNWDGTFTYIYFINFSNGELLYTYPTSSITKRGRCVRTLTNK